jgi:glycerophosphoryl diester phosphodiesterase
VLTAECEVGWDLPYGAPVSDALLRAAVLAGIDWVFVENGALTPEAVAAAHARGLRVMAYTVNRREELERLAPELPDGVITDTAGWLDGVGSER